MDKREQGQWAEHEACVYLRRRGMRLITSNYSCRHGEIDLVMKDKDYTVFVEVRYRRNRDFGGGLASVDFRKQRKLVATAQHYLQRNTDSVNARFDVVAVDANRNIDWVSDAFEAECQ